MIPRGIQTRSLKILADTLRKTAQSGVRRATYQVKKNNGGVNPEEQGNEEIYHKCLSASKYAKK